MTSIDYQRKPNWVKVSPPSGENYHELIDQVKSHGLNTVCQESKCPNIGECWNQRTATLMVLGSVCTRACQFCAVDTGNPKGWLDSYEPLYIAKTVAYMNLDYVVITSVDRDDLEDGGATHIASCVVKTKILCPQVTVEVLSPDFRGNLEHLDILLNSGLDVFSQNLETVRRLTQRVRDPRAGYEQTLKVLEYAATQGLTTKSGLMLGLGETFEEMKQAMTDLFNCGVEILTLGQYLRPTVNHLPVEEYINLETFQDYEFLGHHIGLKEVVAGPLVRSSYRADQSYKRLKKLTND
jgi:lipoic acid synthetase